jgi:penicillin-insensitive murein endopeptidase
MRTLLPVALFSLSLSCVGPGLLSDGSSISVGNTSTGVLRKGVTLPFSGEGYRVPKRWRDRRRNFGTDELVQLLVRAARRVHRSHRNSLLGIADIGPRGGGPTPEHRSHRNGRDVDLLLYNTDMAGKPLPPDEMIHFDRDGLSILPTSQPASAPATAPGGAAATATSTATAATTQRKLDLNRTWALVKATVTDPDTPVQWIFVDRSITRLLLLHAKRRKEPSFIVERAAAVLHHSRGHNDHMHLRVFCAPSDRAHGCVDRGPSRWLKKEIKYIDAPPAPRATIPGGLLARLSLRPLRLLGL